MQRFETLIKNKTGPHLPGPGPLSAGSCVLTGHSPGPPSLAGQEQPPCPHAEPGHAGSKDKYRELQLRFKLHNLENIWALFFCIQISPYNDKNNSQRQCRHRWSPSVWSHMEPIDNRMGEPGT